MAFCRGEKENLGANLRTAVWCSVHLWANLAPRDGSAGLRLKVLFWLHLRLSSLEVTVPTEVPVNLHVSLLPTLVLPPSSRLKSILLKMFEQVQ